MKKRSSSKERACVAVQTPRRQTQRIPLTGHSIPSKWKILLQALLIVAIGVWVYWPCLHGGWLWDDDTLIAHNGTLRRLPGLWTIWFTVPETDYWPVTFSALWVQWHLWGTNPLGYHLCNLVLHLSSGFLLWRLFNKLGLRWGWLGGLVFVIHPLTVESVAWMSEVKNTLSLFFFLLSLAAFIDYDSSKNECGYLGSLFLYIIAMLCKTSTVMLPTVLLLYAWWKRGHITRLDLKSTAPFFAMALIFGSITIYLQGVHTGEDPAVASVGVISRLVGGGVAICFYIEKFLLPAGLLPVYPRWALDPPSLLQVATLPLLALLLGGLWKCRRGWSRHVLLGGGFFLLTVLPVLGLLKMSYCNISLVADHFVYLPLIGVIGIEVAGLEAIYGRLAIIGRPFYASSVVALGILLAWESHEYAKVWISSKALWTYTTERNSGSALAHYNLGSDLAKTPGRLLDAISQYKIALAIQPNYAEAHCNLGNALSNIPGHLPEAISEYQTALRINPNLAETHNNLGRVLQTLPDQLPNAISEYRTALRIKPDFAEAHYNLGAAEEGIPGHLTDAISEYETAVKLKPDFVEAHYCLALLFADSGRLPEAIAELKATLQFKPDDPEAHYNLGAVLAQIQGGLPEAISEYRKALQLRPEFPQANNNLGNALTKLGRLDEAIIQYQTAILRKPDFTEARNNLAIVQQMLHR